MKHENGVGPQSLLFWQKIMRERPLLAFDFDGTLAPTVAVHNGSFPRAETLGLLKKLEKYCEIAIITGRSIKNLKQQLRLSKHARLTFRPSFIIGNHGIEMPWDAKAKKLFARSHIWAKGWKSEIHEQLEKFPEITWIEYKQATLTLHIKRGKNNRPSQKLKNWLHRNLTQDPRLAKEKGWTKKTLPAAHVRLLDGKKVLNVIPLDDQYPSLDKGSALHTLMQSRKKKIAIYSGDDTTDEDVFIARPLKGQRVIGVRVGRHSDSRARFYLTDQEKMDNFLRLLLQAAEK